MSGYEILADTLPAFVILAAIQFGVSATSLLCRIGKS